VDTEPKISNVIDKIRQKARSGEFIILPHAMQRKKERDITVVDIIHVLIHGEHEESKDQYQIKYRTWNYAVRGKTLDNRDLRIAVSFDENQLLIITVFRLGRRK
jgi:ribosomal silencing factor RsfS